MTTPTRFPLGAFFAGYVVLTGLIFLFLPRVWFEPYLMPWDYSWVFVFVTPPLAAVVVRRQSQLGRVSSGGCIAFVLATLLLGLVYYWFSMDLSGVV